MQGMCIGLFYPPLLVTGSTCLNVFIQTNGMFSAAGDGLNTANTDSMDARECSHAWDLIQISKTFMCVFRETVSTCRGGWNGRNKPNKGKGLKAEWQSCAKAAGLCRMDNVGLCVMAELMDGWTDESCEDSAVGIPHFQSGTNRNTGRQTTKIFLSGKCII